MTADEIARIQGAYHKRLVSGVRKRYALSNPGERYMQERREYLLLRLLALHGMQDFKSKKILEVGCGRGERLEDYMRWSAAAQNLYGVDLMPEFIAEAEQRLPEAHFSAGSAEQLAFPDAYFDVVAQYTVFTSILDATMKQKIAAEMQRVVKRNGVIVWYDFRYPNPKNPDVKPIAAAEIRRLFPACNIDLHPVTLLPPLARALARYSFAACRMLEFLPPLRSHYLAIIRKTA